MRVRGGGPGAKRAREFALAEWGAVAHDVTLRLRTRGLRAVPLTLSSCAGILALQLVQHSEGASNWVDRLGGVYATLPWWQAVLRTPLSLFVPDPSLPVWGLIVQVVVVFGIAETTVGARRSLGIALLTSEHRAALDQLGVAFQLFEAVVIERERHATQLAVVLLRIVDLGRGIFFGR